MKNCLPPGLLALIVAASCTLAAVGQEAFDPPMPAPGERTKHRGRPAVLEDAPDELPSAEENRSRGAAHPAAPVPPPEPELIELSGRLRRPGKWYPQLELIPRGRDIGRIDLGGALLDGIEEGTPIRVRGVVQSWLHPGDSPQNRSPFPAQWNIQLHVTQLEVLEDPQDVLKEAREKSLLRVFEKRIREALPEIEKALGFEYPKSTRSLVVNYRTRRYLVHGQSRRGEYDDDVHEMVGPSYDGFQLTIYLQEAGTNNAAQVPATIRKPYWATDLDVQPIEGTDKQVYVGLSYGGRVDGELLKPVREVVTRLGRPQGQPGN